MLVHGTEKGFMSYLKNLRAKRTAEIGNLTMTKSGKIRDSKFHSLIIINTYISSRRIPNNIVIEKHGRCVAGFKVTESMGRSEKSRVQMRPRNHAPA